jgi:DMSO/TMAO reductase YedYZ molybdopterin-dependent catalytic subunit
VALFVVRHQHAAGDPEKARRDAIDGGLRVRREHPLSCEASPAGFIGGVATPNSRFYIRNHFEMPRLDPTAFRLKVGGLAERPQSFSLDDLRRMPSQSLTVTLECAGNGRSLFRPRIVGEKWNLGAVSTAEWTGVPLAEVLDRAGVQPGAREVLFRGADGGTSAGDLGPNRFERSLLLDHARDPNLLLAYAMNGEALPIEHGYPLRLVVPGWYAMASVKWLTEIELIDRPFAGYYQAKMYCYEWEREGALVREPVTLQCVRALITEPAPNQEVAAGELAIRGVAWSGVPPIAHVEVSVGGGSWQEARLLSEQRRYAWQPWELLTQVQEPGVVVLRARATDLAGRTQPERAEWNRLGYGNNTTQQVPVRLV